MTTCDARFELAQRTLHDGPSVRRAGTWCGGLLSHRPPVVSWPLQREAANRGYPGEARDSFLPFALRDIGIAVERVAVGAAPRRASGFAKIATTGLGVISAGIG